MEIFSCFLRYMDMIYIYIIGLRYRICKYIFAIMIIIWRRKRVPGGQIRQIYWFACIQIFNRPDWIICIFAGKLHPEFHGKPAKTNPGQPANLPILISDYVYVNQLIYIRPFSELVWTQTDDYTYGSLYIYI